MKLQIEHINIKDVVVGSKTCISDHILHINLLELREIILKDDRIKSVEFNIVYPGDRLRIANVVDIIQPRCKIDRENEDFPGWLGKLAIAGRGRTRSLDGISIVLSNSFSNRPYSAIVDMFGVGAELGKYGRMKNLSIDPMPSDNLGEREFESAVKLSGLKTAVYLARAGEGHSVDLTEVYELDMLDQRKSNLPRVAYYHLMYTPQHDYQGLSDPIFYGASVTNSLPTIIHPNEILDGAIINAHTIRGMETYSIQNHAIIKELYKRNGKELNFAGVVIGVASMEPIQRQRVSLMAANLISNVLRADGVILTKIHGGMPHVDLALIGEACEDFGVKTTLFCHVWSNVGSLSDYALFSSESVNAIVSIGYPFEKIHLPQAERILARTSEKRVGQVHQRAGDNEAETELFLIAGTYDYLGGSKIIAVEY